MCFRHFLGWDILTSLVRRAPLSVLARTLLYGILSTEQSVQQSIWSFDNQSTVSYQPRELASWYPSCYHSPGCSYSMNQRHGPTNGLGRSSRLTYRLLASRERIKWNSNENSSFANIQRWSVDEKSAIIVVNLPLNLRPRRAAHFVQGTTMMVWWCSRDGREMNSTGQNGFNCLIIKGWWRWKPNLIDNRSELEASFSRLTRALTDTTTLSCCCRWL